MVVQLNCTVVRWFNCTVEQLKSHPKISHLGLNGSSIFTASRPTYSIPRNSSPGLGCLRVVFGTSSEIQLDNPVVPTFQIPYQE